MSSNYTTPCDCLSTALSICHFRKCINVFWQADAWRLTDCKGGDALLVRAQSLSDGAHGATVVSVLHVTQALLSLRKLLQAVQPEVEVLWCHTSPQTLVQLAGELMASLQINDNSFIILLSCCLWSHFNENIY